MIYDRNDSTNCGGITMFQILVVEDDKDLNRTVCTFLNHSGYKATGCLSAAEARPQKILCNRQSMTV